MLVLTRECGQEIYLHIDPAQLKGPTTIVVKVASLGRSRARIGIEAPPQVVVLRDDAKRRAVPGRVS